ncbi:type II secretion system protein F [Arthrobacter crusticola]|uniref:Type II secretion system protein F n=1 Tax=Arthrobacter crusticola TaxID=2547960 RepID=A0A4R5TXN8_9MICC|nr:type II secretion system protein F [Arthrobacter crusticola]
MDSPVLFFTAVGMCSAALFLVFVVVLKPRQSAIPLHRRRPSTAPELSVFSRVTESTVTAVDGVIGEKGGLFNKETLYNAGIKASPAEVTVFVVAASVVSGVVTGVFIHPAVSLFSALATPFLAKFLLNVRTNRRRMKFDSQLPDTIQTLIGGLRAGHSVMRSIDAVAVDADSPTSEELARIINETRIGKDAEQAIEDAARRMASEDFEWIAQAIQIHREVGGDLAEVLEHVAETIRERSEIKGMIRSLSAEGVMSAYILMGLPVAIAVLFRFINPTYMVVLIEHPIGIAMIALSVIMYAIGGFWLSRMIKIKF